MTDLAGQAVATYEYDPYGQTITIGGTAGASFNWPFRYTGAFLSTDTGLYHNGARYYDPKLGRWTQTDPLNQVSDLREANRYGYVAGDPINFTDPSGCGIDEFITCVLYNCGEDVITKCGRFLLAPIVTFQQHGVPFAIVPPASA